MIQNGNYVSNSGVIIGDINQQLGKSPSGHQNNIQKGKNNLSTFSYDVAISYASEQEHMVHRVVKILEAEGLRVFFAPNQESEFMADDMFERFYRIYRYESRYVAAFVTEDYLRKDITMHEASTAMLRRQSEGRNCLIPIYFGKAALEKLDSDINYIRGDNLREAELAEKIRMVVLTQNR